MREAAQHIQEWEGLAVELGEETGCDDPPVDAFELADCAEFEVRAAQSGLSRLDLEERVIRVDLDQRPERVHMSIAHELGHWLLKRAGSPDSEWGAKYIGGALMMPRTPFGRHLTRTAWSIPRLRALHTNTSATAMAVRITQLRDAVATIVDPRGHKKPWRILSPWIADRALRHVSRWERELARQAYEAGDEVRGDELCYAVPLTDHPREHRVLVVCELEQLALRL